MKCEFFIVVDADENCFVDSDRDDAIQQWTDNDGVVPARVIKLTLQVGKPVAEEFLGTIPADSKEAVVLVASDSPGGTI